MAPLRWDALKYVRGGAMEDGNNVEGGAVGEIQRVGCRVGVAAARVALHHVGVGGAFPDMVNGAGAGLIMGGGEGTSLCMVAIMAASVGGDFALGIGTGGGLLLTALGDRCIDRVFGPRARATVGFFWVLLRPTARESRC